MDENNWSRSYGPHKHQWRTQLHEGEVNGEWVVIYKCYCGARTDD